MMRVALGLLLAAAVALSAQIPAPSIQFRDATAASGLRFTHENGATGKKYLPESLGPGCAFIDYDNDGWQDVVFVNGKAWPPQPGNGSTLKLFHNNRNGTFADVTAAAGLALELYGMGAAVGDYDNDGNDDLFVTALGQNHLFRNNGNGKFVDVTRSAGMLGIDEFSTSAAFLDYDRDGLLDLFVANYVQWSQAADIFCTVDGQKKSYCTPESYKGASARLWHNQGNGVFEDVTKKAGVYDPTAKGMGVAILDYNRDGFPDVVLSNDTQPNKLYVNSGKGTFTEKGTLAGIGFSEDGVARAGMGIDTADYDRSGNSSILITNFSNQMISLYHNEGKGLFIDDAPRSGIGRPSLLTLGFGCFFFDYDLDGWLDVFVANGHIESGVERVQKRVTYAQPPHLFRNLGAGRFQETTASAGPAFAAPRVARGAAFADIDNDGDLDILVVTNGGPAVLFENTVSGSQSLRVRLIGTRSNRSGIGAVIDVTAGSDTQSQMLRSGSSYLSQSELRLTFGLGSRTQADTLTVRWPDGQVERLSNLKSGQAVTIQEGRGVIGSTPFIRPGRSR